METNCANISRPKTVKEFFKSWYFWKPFLGIIIGGIGGYLVYYFIGCESGACVITRNPFSSIVTGSVLGYLVSGFPCLKGKSV
jgi:hypothetical protein